MTYEEHINAMKIGYTNPLLERDTNDLGRFGLGLKTASFSQCKCLSVFSKTRGNQQTVLCWDLDYLQDKAKNHEDWIILKRPGNKASELSNILNNHEQGTLVVWEKLDKIFADGFDEQQYLDLIDDIEQHIAITFHRFLSSNKLKININGKKISAIDPFFTRNLACISSPEGRSSISSCAFKIRHFTLPTEKQLSEQEKKTLGSNNDLINHQGFYIYRNNRLILQGSWLDLGDDSKKWTKEECFKYARISIDISNKDDMSWKIDIKKSKASPPANIRSVMLHVGKTAREQSRTLYYHNHGVNLRRNVIDIAHTVPIWEGFGNIGENREYKISRRHPLVEKLFNEVADHDLLEKFLTLLEKDLPIVEKVNFASEQDKLEKKSNMHPQNYDEEKIRNLIKTIVGSLKGIESDERILYKLSHDPIFKNYPQLIAEFINLD